MIKISTIFFITIGITLLLWIILFNALISGTLFLSMTIAILILVIMTIATAFTIFFMKIDYKKMEGKLK